MPVSKQTRRSRHEQAENPTLKRGNPSSTEGRVGTQQFRNIPGKGLVHMVRADTGWKELGSSQSSTSKGDKVESITVSAGVSASSGVSSTGAAASVHGNLTSLSEDDHSQYVHLSNVRTITGNHTFSGAPLFTNINVNGGDIASQTTINKSPVVTLAGDLGGNATFTNLGNATLTATIQPNSVALTTDTTGNYMTNVTGNSQVSVSHTQSEGSTAALSIANDSIGDTQLAYNTGQHLTTSSNVQFGAITATTLNTGQGANELYDMNQNVLTTSSPQFSNMTFGEYSNPNYSNGEIGTSTFASGFVGTGWKMYKSGNEYNLETNNMTIRGTLSVYELLIQQIRATNGAIFVTSCAKVDSWDNANSQITFEDPSNNNICPFAVNDIIMMQRIQPGSLAAADGTESGLTQIIKKVVYKVTAINGKIATVTSSGVGYTNSSTPANGDDFVRIGNTTDTARQGVIYLTSDDSEAPFIDIKSDIDSYSDWTGSTPKVRLGKLDGITDTNAGLSGSQSELYGLYSDSVYLKGHIYANTGTIANSVTIGGTAASTIEEKANASQSSSDVNGATKTSGYVGGWTIDSEAIYSGSKVSSGYSSNGQITLLSSGEIHTPTFYVESNGTSAFKGTLTIGSTNLTSTNTFNSNTTKSDVNLSNVEDKSSASIRGEITKANVTDTGLGKGDIGLGLVDNTSDNSVLSTAATAANNATKTSGYVGGWQINSTSILGIADGAAQIVMTASGNIATGQWSINRDGSASFADNNITFANNGDITSNTYLIERTRLFGGGQDSYNGSSYVDTWISTSSRSSAYGENTYAVNVPPETSSEVSNGYGSRIMYRDTTKWYMQSDAYFNDFTVKTGVILHTRGYRIFCKGTFTVESGASVYNLGSGGADGGGGDTSGGVGGGGAGGAGGLGGSLAEGTSGSAGGAAGEGGLHGMSGGAGGGGGGTGGTILISARYISNSGTIRASGGDGGDGGQSAGV